MSTRESELEGISTADRRTSRGFSKYPPQIVVPVGDLVNIHRRSSDQYRGFSKYPLESYSRFRAGGDLLNVHRRNQTGRDLVISTHHVKGQRQRGFSKCQHS